MGIESLSGFSIINATHPMRSVTRNVRGVSVNAERTVITVPDWKDGAPETATLIKP